MILRLPLDLLCLFALLLIAAAAGRKLLNKFLRIDIGDNALNLLLGTGLGLALIAWGTLAIGFAGGLYPSVFYLFFALLFVISLREAGEVGSYLKGVPGAFLRSPASGFERILILMIAAAAAANLLFAYSPPTQVRELLYDLNLPKMYLDQRRIFDASDRHLAYFPLQIQTLYLMAMTVKGVLLAKLIHYALGILALALLWRLAARIFDERSALLSAAIFYLMPMMTSLSGSANIDLGTLFYGLLTVAAYLRWLESGENRVLCLAGFLAGLTSSTKVSGVAVALTLLVLVTFRLLRQKEPLPSLAKKVLMMGGFIFLALAPWIARNVAFTGNPMMPYSFPLFGWKGHEAALMEIRLCRAATAALTWRDYLRGYHNFLYGGFIYGAGPLVFAFLVPAFFRQEKRGEAARLFWIGAVNYLFLNALLYYPHRFYETRYYAVSYALFALLAGAGAHWMMERSWKPPLARAVVLSLLLLPPLGFSIYMAAARLPVLLGRISTEDYLRRKLPNYPLVEFGNAHVPAGAKVITIGGGECHFYYWKARIIDPPLALMKEREPGQILARLKELGVSYVIFFENSYRPDDAEPGILRHHEVGDLDLFWDMRKLKGNYLEEIYRLDRTVLYKIAYPA